MARCVHLHIVRIHRSTAATQTLSRVTSMQDLIKSRVLIYCLPGRGAEDNARRWTAATRGELEASRRPNSGASLPSFTAPRPLDSSNNTVPRDRVPPPTTWANEGGPPLSLSPLVHPRITRLFRPGFIMKYDFLRSVDFLSIIDWFRRVCGYLMRN